MGFASANELRRERDDGTRVPSTRLFVPATAGERAPDLYEFTAGRDPWRVVGFHQCSQTVRVTFWLTTGFVLDAVRVTLVRALTLIVTAALVDGVGAVTGERGVVGAFGARPSWSFR